MLASVSTKTLRGNLGRGTILLADSDRGVVTALAWYFSKQGYEVIKAYAGSSALEKTRGLLDPLTAVIVDNTLSDMEGADLYAALLSSFPMLPVLFTSNDRSVVLNAENNRACALIYKPFTMGAVDRALTTLLSNQPVIPSLVGERSSGVRTAALPVASSERETIPVPRKVQRQ